MISMEEELGDGQAIGRRARVAIRGVGPSTRAGVIGHADRARPVAMIAWA